MKRKRYIWRITLLVQVAVLAGTASRRDAQAQVYKAQAGQPSDTAGSDDTMASALGVLVVKDYGKRDTVRVLNEDGSLWYKFTFYYDDSDGKWDYPNPDFIPRAFHPDNFLLALDVIEVTGNQYSVVVNSQTGLRKRIKKAPFLRLLSWDKYVLTAFSVTFNPIDNPVRVRPQSSATPIRFVSGVDYQPESIDGDWLRVKWGDQGAEKHGWIRWRSGNRLLVTIHPFD